MKAKNSSSAVEEKLTAIETAEESKTLRLDRIDLNYVAKELAEKYSFLNQKQRDKIVRDMMKAQSIAERANARAQKSLQKAEEKAQKAAEKAAAKLNEVTAYATTQRVTCENSHLSFEKVFEIVCEKARNVSEECYNEVVSKQKTASSCYFETLRVIELYKAAQK